MKKPSKSIQDKFYKNLYENYEELSGFLTSALDSQYRDMEEMRYLSEFIRYKIPYNLHSSSNSTISVLGAGHRDCDSNVD